MSDIRKDPAYADGFEDAKDGEPLFDTASTAYAAGWRAFHNFQESLTAAGFKQTAPGAFTKTMKL